MIWQDYVIAAIGFAFSFMILPQVIDSYRGKSFLNLITSSLTISALVVLGITFATMDMWISAGANISTGFMWILLLYFGLKNYRRKKHEDTVVSGSNRKK